MAHDGEGKIYIPLEDFWKFVQGYVPQSDAETVFGVPQFTDEDVVVDYAFSTECNPAEWVKKPKALLQWEEHRAKEKEQC